MDSGTGLHRRTCVKWDKHGVSWIQTRKELGMVVEQVRAHSAMSVGQPNKIFQVEGFGVFSTMQEAEQAIQESNLSK